MEYPKKADFEEQSTPEKPRGRPVERDSKGTVESLDDVVAHKVEKKDAKERFMLLILLIEGLLRKKLYKQVVEILARLLKTRKD